VTARDERAGGGQRVVVRSREVGRGSAPAAMCRVGGHSSRNWLAKRGSIGRCRGRSDPPGMRGAIRPAGLAGADPAHRQIPARSSQSVITKRLLVITLAMLAGQQYWSPCPPTGLTAAGWRMCGTRCALVSTASSKPCPAASTACSKHSPQQAQPAAWQEHKTMIASTVARVGRVTANGR
jgi:hypothetical protein